MTYFGFLLMFLALPIGVLTFIDARKRQTSRMPWGTIAAQVALALAYTTPWDNHLVATGVWYYSRKQVAGLVLGYVPLEEYAFFVLETLLVALWWRLCTVRVRSSGNMHASTLARAWAAGSGAALWVVLAVVFLKGWRPGTYLLLILLWALPPILLQLAYGADILWHERRLVTSVIIPVGIYLSAADALAIRAGIWAIDPAQSTGVFFGGLPVEEAVFFFITIILITFGMTLALSEESRKRLPLLNRNSTKAATSE